MEHKVTCVLVMVLMLAVSTLAEDQAGKEASSCFLLGAVSKPEGLGEPWLPSAYFQPLV
jgi:hypothetical protein